MPKIEDIEQAPKDGSRILLLYHVKHYIRGEWQRDGTKWEECRWVSKERYTGSKPHWQPWCGNVRTETTNHIKEEDAIAWTTTGIV